MSCPKNFGEELKLSVSDTDGSEEKTPRVLRPSGNRSYDILVTSSDALYY